MKEQLKEITPFYWMTEPKLTHKENNVKEFVNLVNLDILFQNLKGEIMFWGNSVLPQHLMFFVICHKTHTCPVCGEVNCKRDHTSPTPDPGEGGDHGVGEPLRRLLVNIADRQIVRESVWQILKE